MKEKIAIYLLGILDGLFFGFIIAFMIFKL